MLETLPQVFCFPNSRINENGGKEAQQQNFELAWPRHYKNTFISTET